MSDFENMIISDEPYKITVYTNYDKARQDEIEYERYIAENPLCQLWYDVIGADIECGIKQHPQKQMRELGYTILDATPQSIADGWEFTVDKFIEPLPPYLRKIRYDIEKT